MTSIEGLMYGFDIAMSSANLLACFTGVLLGTIIGILPGIGPLGALAMLLPTTYMLSPVAAIIMLMGIWYGSMFGGAASSILINIPGEATAIVTTFDGHPLARKGRAGAALAVAAVSSFVAGTIGLVGLLFFAPVLSKIGIAFGGPEFFALITVGMLILSTIGRGSILQAFFMMALGLAISTIGIERSSGLQRFTFGFNAMSEGISLIPVAMGLLGIPEVLAVLERDKRAEVKAIRFSFKDLFPARAEWLRLVPTMLRGGITGFFVGLLPGPGGFLGTFAAYALEKKISKHPEQFGTGILEGVAAPEAGNNGGCVGGMVPLLALGIPFNAVTALILGGLLIHGISVGPFLMTQQPEIFWGVIASLYIGNVILLILNFPLVGLFSSILRVPQHLLMVFVLLFCIIGSYNANNSVFGIVVLIIMGCIGYVCQKFELDISPLILALVLGPMLEDSIIDTLHSFNGEFWRVLTRPIASGIFAFGLVILGGILMSKYLKYHRAKSNLCAHTQGTSS